MSILDLLLCAAMGIACPETRLFDAGQAVEALYYSCRSLAIDAPPAAIAIGRRQDGTLVWERGMSLYAEGEPAYPEPYGAAGAAEPPLPPDIVPAAFFARTGIPPAEAYLRLRKPGSPPEAVLAWLAADAKRPEAQEFTLYEFAESGKLRESRLAIRSPASYQNFRAEVDQVPAQHRRPIRVYSDAEMRQFPSFATRHAGPDWVLYSMRTNESQCAPIDSKEDYIKQHEATVRIFQ